MENKKKTIKTKEELYFLINDEIRRLELNREDLTPFEQAILGIWKGENPYDEK